MQRATVWLEKNHPNLPRGLARWSIRLLRISLGIVFLWFGVLKFFPELSPAQDLATRTIETLTFGIVKPSLSLPLLALWESVIGLGLITGRFLSVTLGLLFVQMLGTFTPLILFPKETWAQFPLAPTLEGQYIIKNIVLVSGAMVVGAVAQGRWLEVTTPSRLDTQELSTASEIRIDRRPITQGR